jgi:flavin-dependent dehydrogenase
LEKFDVVVVGARCAGSPLATQLSRAGVAVALVDKARFPSDTLSTHIFQAEGIRSLERLGVLDRLRATGAPFLDQVHAVIDDIDVTQPAPSRPGDPGVNLCVRRPVLDTILLETAQEAGVHVRTGTAVTEVVQEDGRVVGVRTRNGTGAELRAPLVVGADGRGSVVGRAVGARKYNVTTNERFATWAYYEGADLPSPPTLSFLRWGEEFVIAGQTDDGLFLTVALPSLDRLKEYRAAGEEASHDAYVMARPELADALRGARRIAPPQRMLRYAGYLRESAGPGWVLVGDAGHFKDPAPGQGISDALRQQDRLVPAIVEGLGGGGRALDEATRAWWRWRDEDAAEKYWFANDLGKAGRVPLPFVEIVRKAVSGPEGISRFADIFNHRTKPSQFLTPPALLGASARLVRRGGVPRRQVLNETRTLIATELGRRRLNRRPRYGDGGVRDETDEEAAAAP